MEMLEHSTQNSVVVIQTSLLLCLFLIWVKFHTERKALVLGVEFSQPEQSQLVSLTMVLSNELGQHLLVFVPLLLVSGSQTDQKNVVQLLLTTLNGSA